MTYLEPPFVNAAKRALECVGPLHPEGAPDDHAGCGLATFFNNVAAGFAVKHWVELG